MLPFLFTSIKQVQLSYHSRYVSICMSLQRDPNKWQFEGVVRSRDLVSYFHKGDEIKVNNEVPTVISWMPLWTEQWGRKLNYPQKKFLFRNCFLPKAKENNFFYNLGMGSPISAMLIEDLHSIGSKSVLSVGLCGSLNNRFNFGDIVVVTEAYRDEGTSNHYWPKEEKVVSANIKLVENINNYFLSMDLKFHNAKAWTTDALYKETKSDIEYFLAQDFEVVDMEAAAIYSVGLNLNVPTLSIFVVSDQLTDGIWKPGFRDERVKNSYFNLLNALKNYCHP